MPSTGPAGKRAAGEAWPRPRAKWEIDERGSGARVRYALASALAPTGTAGRLAISSEISATTHSTAAV